MLFCVGRFVVLRRSSGRHKWRPYVCERSNVVLRRPFCGVARRGAIYDARCRNGTIGRPRLASADVACCGRFVVLYWPVRGFAVVIRASQVAPVRLRGGRMLFCVGRFAVLRWSSGRHKWRPYVCERLTVVLRRSSGRHKWRPHVCGAVDCCFASVVRASQMAPCVFCVRRPCGFFEPSGKGGLHSGGFPKILCFPIVVTHVCITFAA